MHYLNAFVQANRTRACNLIRYQQQWQEREWYAIIKYSCTYCSINAIVQDSLYKWWICFLLVEKNQQKYDSHPPKKGKTQYTTDLATHYRHPMISLSKHFNDHDAYHSTSYLTQCKIRGNHTLNCSKTTVGSLLNDPGKFTSMDRFCLLILKKLAAV